MYIWCRGLSTVGLQVSWQAAEARGDGQCPPPYLFPPWLVGSMPALWSVLVSTEVVVIRNDPN